MKKNDILKLTKSPAFKRLDLNIRLWFLDHLIEPVEIKIYDMNDTSKLRNLWRITADIGRNDSDYRVVYSNSENQFGLEVVSDQNINFFLSFYGTLENTLENM